MADYVKAAELARKLSVDRMTIMRLTRAGKLPFIRVGNSYRFCCEEVMKALEGK